MTGIDLFRQLVAQARSLLEGTLADVTPAHASWLPDGRAVTICGQYAHVIASQDMGLAMLRRGVPIAMGPLPGRTGFTGLPAFGQPWDEWALQEGMNLAALREYASEVYQASDAQFAGMTDADLERSVDLTAAGLGQVKLGFVLYNGWILNPAMHCGEISCLKGLQGAKGYSV